MKKHASKGLRVILGILLGVGVLMMAIGGCSSRTLTKQQTATGGWPKKPITVVVQFAAGGATDQVCRALAAELQKILGTPVNVQNMPGATGAVATSYVLGQPRDGYTLLGVSDNIRQYQVMDLGNFSYKDFHMWIAAAGVTSLAVRTESPLKSIDDFLKAMKEKGENFTVAASGAGTGWHISMELLKAATGYKYKFVPYDGGHPSITATIAGEVDATATGIMEQMDFIKGGKLRPLATFSDKPMTIEGIGTIPSIGDIVPKLKDKLPFGGWWGIAVPKDVPEEVVKKLDEAYAKAVQSSRFQEFIKKQYMTLLGYDRQKSEELAKRDTSVVSWLLQDLGMAKKSPESFGIPKP